MTNVLLSCAGRRTTLLAHLMDAAHQRGGEVWAGDMNHLAPTLQLADHAVRLPSATSDEYVPALLDLVRAHDISLVVPTIDPELPVLAAAADEFAAAGCTALVSSADFVEACGDKWVFHERFSRLGIRTPRSWVPETVAPSEMPEELFLKPRRGSASIGVRALTRAELADGFDGDDDPIIQERITASEVTIDALLGLDGTPVHYVPRRRIRTMAGESIQGVTLPRDGFEPWIDEVFAACRELGARGPITLQAFDTDDGPLLFEINPRFGGGFPLAHAAGGRYPEWVMDMLAGTEVPPRIGEYTVGLYMTRYNTELFTTELPW